MARRYTFTCVRCHRSAKRWLRGGKTGGYYVRCNHCGAANPGPRMKRDIEAGLGGESKAPESTAPKPKRKASSTTPGKKTTVVRKASPTTPGRKGASGSRSAVTSSPSAGDNGSREKESTTPAKKEPAVLSGLKRWVQ